MKYILHMSDFHFGKAPEIENERIELLAKWIKKNNIVVRYVVYTGDVIDARTITQMCVLDIVRDHVNDFKVLLPALCDKDGLYKGKKLSELSEKESYEVLFQSVNEYVDLFISQIQQLGDNWIADYNARLLNKANLQVDNAIKTVTAFLRDISVPFDQFISCCGNHDRLRYLSSQKDSFSCNKEHHLSEELYEDVHEPYNRFCHAINNKLNYKTIVYSHDNVNFIIANSNWRTPSDKETNNMCIHCGKLMELLNELRSRPTFERKRNIFIAHKPFDDLCENAKFPYDSDQELTAREIIEQTTSMFLHGDKHSYAVKSKNWLKEFMCGTPLTWDRVRYNLIGYDPQEGVQASRFLLFSDGAWTQIPIMEFIDNTYAVSEQYLKKYAFTFLDQNKKAAINAQGAIRLIQDSMDSDRMFWIQQLFSSCVKLYDENGKKKSFDKNALLESFIAHVEDSDKWLALGVKGQAGSGKSTFLTIEYMYLLWRFYSGNCKYIPFYFNADALTQSIEQEMSEKGYAQDVEVIIESYFSKFAVFLENAINLSNKYGIPICLIVDGLDTLNVITDTGLALESKVYNLLDSQFMGTKHKCVMGLNTHRSELFEKSFAQATHFTYALFFNPIYTVPYKQDERYPGFLEAYLMLTKGADTLEFYTKNFNTVLKKLRRTSIDLNFLNAYDNLLCGDTSEVDSWSLMRKQVSRTNQRCRALFSKKERLDYAAYQMRLKGSTYQAICENEETENILFSDFIKMKDHPEIGEFLVAEHFIAELKKYTNSDEAIPDDSILHCFITRNLGVMIRLQMEETGFQYKGLKRFVERHADELHGHLISTIVYLAGHNKKPGNAALIKNIQTSVQEESEFFRFCAKRSRELALIASEENRPDLVNGFIHDLFTDEAFRAFNRSYQLHYYRDIPAASDYDHITWRIDQAKGIGFDFSNCFLVLVSKLDYCFENFNPYPMMEIDLYTLCDLAYSRLQMFGEKKALFYSRTNNREGDSLAIAILGRIIDLIKRYMTDYAQKRGVNNLVQTYFRFMEKKFGEIIDILKENSGKDIKKPLVPLSKDIKDIIYLMNQPRVGWNTQTPKTVQKKNRPKYARPGVMGMPEPNWGQYNPVLETIGQHVLECMYIAQLFLPESLPIEGYSKNTVLSMLLMSEIGKLQFMGDYTSLYSGYQDRETEERASLHEFLLRGTIDGYANFSELFGKITVFGTTTDSPADINMRICHEIKRIQMEYKYYALFNILCFEDVRTQKVMEGFIEPKTAICKDIRKKLIFDNPDFAEHFRRNS